MLSPVVRMIALSLLFLPLWCAADPLNQALTLDRELNREAARSQKRIDTLDDDARALLAEYRQLQQRIELLRADNRQLEARVAAQDTRIESLHRQLDEVQVVRRELPELTGEMAAVLGTFVAADLPFLRQERLQRLQRLRDNQHRAELGEGEKFRRLLEAYDVELEYGRTLETWRSQVDIDGESRTVQLFRLGRTGLYYLSLDHGHGGVWDPQHKTWLPVSSDTLRQLSAALGIARNQAAPQFLTLPLPAPVGAVAEAP